MGFIYKHTISRNIRTILSILFIVVYISQVSIAQVIRQEPPELKKIDIQEHLGDKLPLDLKFTNDAGEEVALGRYFNRGKPVILVLAYYTCPMLCTLVLNGLANGLKQLSWTPGDQFQVLTVSIDPYETWQLAQAKKAAYLEAVGKPHSGDGWRFFVGQQDQIQALADTIGFKYYYDEKQKQYAHPAMILILTPDGEISRYLYGVSFSKQDLRLGLLEASEGRIGNTIDKIILYCYHYDPQAGGYVLFAANVMRLGGVVTVGALALILGIFWVKERRRKTIK